MNDLAKLILDLCSHTIYAEGGTEIVNKVQTVLNDVIGEVKLIATPIAVLCAVFCGIKLLIASDAQSVRQAKSWLITIAVALMIIYLAEPLVNTITSIVNV